MLLSVVVLECCCEDERSRAFSPVGASCSGSDRACAEMHAGRCPRRLMCHPWCAPKWPWTLQWACRRFKRKGLCTRSKRALLPAALSPDLPARCTCNMTACLLHLQPACLPATCLPATCRRACTPACQHAQRVWAPHYSCTCS